MKNGSAVSRGVKILMVLRNCIVFTSAHAIATPHFITDINLILPNTSLTFTLGAGKQDSYFTTESSVKVRCHISAMELWMLISQRMIVNSA